MAVFPDVEVKTLADCKAGQLVRSLEYGEADRVGVVFDALDGENELRGIVSFRPEGPEFGVEDSPEQFKVLAHSGKVVWEIDQSGPIETNARTMFDKAGAAICHGDGWLLNVASFAGGGFPRTKLQLNIQTGELVPYKERLKRVATFGAWFVYLEEPGRPVEHRWKVFGFKLEAKV